MHRVGDRVSGGTFDPWAEFDRLEAVNKELLEALKAALPALQARYAEHGTQRYREVMEQAEAAIAKAEGK